MDYNCRKRKFIKEKGCKYKENHYTKQTAELSNMAALFRV